MTRLALLAATTALIMGAAGLSPQTLGSAAQAQDAKAVQDGAIDTAEEAATEVIEMSMGNPDAEVTVIEYASFTCPHCKNFHAGPLKELKSEYIDPGKINFIYREIYFDRYGLWAGMLARCGGPARYFGLADLLYEQQSEWTKGEPAQVADNLRRLGKTAGLEEDRIEACMSDADKAQAMVARFEETSKADDINSTPSFVINGKKYSNMNYEDFSEILDAELAE
ncbi:DsbA family protein [Profundibacterium mesophilum]|uniref:Periplasmic thiol-disulfide interchange protein n=1 Tax=Profundibacterium mesophilum KAUST100406-0324 TaxID=1037889 RepID=A0A921NTX7_9RHOB|nr:DsbA family protein [Profundibacterium mesophilum]KAF0675483.1 putative periplasmic thiol-disulfide interchange protein [Profundibacterium mesophilum KAUST100406-0324]